MARLTVWHLLLVLLLVPVNAEFRPRCFASTRSTLSTGFAVDAAPLDPIEYDQVLALPRGGSFLGQERDFFIRLHGVALLGLSLVALLNSFSITIPWLSLREATAVTVGSLYTRHVLRLCSATFMYLALLELEFAGFAPCQNYFALFHFAVLLSSLVGVWRGRVNWILPAMPALFFIGSTM